MLKVSKLVGWMVDWKAVKLALDLVAWWVGLKVGMMGSLSVVSMDVMLVKQKVEKLVVSGLTLVDLKDLSLVGVMGQLMMA